MKKETLSVKDVTPENIWLYAQNKPSLVVADLAAYGVPEDAVMQILLARGVCKWLSARRDLIKVKDGWKEQIVKCHEELKRCKAARDFKGLNRVRGKLEALNACRKEVRAICHSERWRVPDFDNKAAAVLKRLAK